MTKILNDFHHKIAFLNSETNIAIDIALSKRRDEAKIIAKEISKQAIIPLCDKYNLSFYCETYGSVWYFNSIVDNTVYLQQDALFYNVDFMSKSDVCIFYNLIKIFNTKIDTKNFSYMFKNYSPTIE